MTPWAIADTGPLVALLDRRERYHTWALEQTHALEPPLLVCEAVLTEAMFLLARLPTAQDALLGLLDKGALRLAFQVAEHVPDLRKLRDKYHDRPMSFADACVVRMAEVHARHRIFTLDSDFSIYRTHGNKPILLISPQDS